ncbi:formin-like protein 7 [Canis lupus familiaris]|uniref:formin-like protein 7 n=1 Tax=Canis lupus familiaris TaxID=9615 RepID=UPI0006B3C3D2|nr:formin-like protein 7 [Canis lupus familiaris]XP_038404689.1 formin-like protein 7 [Canis lupus familiaris]XP_038533915.1 formin-like protein 7 [Canis lupus familiaris]|eukprot:XP_013972404.1 formin-like protein 7 [Canis lupus familiaris]
MRRPPRRTAPVHRAAAFQLPGYGQLRLRVPVLPGKFVSVRARPSGNRPLGAVQGAGPGPGYAAPPPPLRGRYRGARPAASVDAPGPQAAGTKARAACGLPQPLSGNQGPNLFRHSERSCAGTRPRTLPPLIHFLLRSLCPNNPLHRDRSHCEPP